jgi:uncharacterized DUF497 family protein
MKIEGIIWLPEIIDKLIWKHHVYQEEVEEIFKNHPIYRKVQKGHIPGEDLYSALGRTEAGRHLIVFFIYKSTQEVLIISARNMNHSERKQYERK